MYIAVPEDRGHWSGGNKNKLLNIKYRTYGGRRVLSKSVWLSLYVFVYKTFEPSTVVNWNESILSCGGLY